MRKCCNCFNGHYSTGPNVEYMYCDIGNIEVEVNEDDDCGLHRYIPGAEENRNYIYYDEFFIAPGFLIVNQDIESGKVNRYLKFYKTNSENFIFGIRAYSNESIFLPNKGISKMEFSFRDIEDDKNGLFNCFNGLYYNLNDKVVHSQGKLMSGLCFEPIINSSSEVTRLFLFANSKALIKGIDIIIGDKNKCENYNAFDNFYNSLFTDTHPSSISENEVKKLILIK